MANFVQKNYQGSLSSGTNTFSLTNASSAGNTLVLMWSMGTSHYATAVSDGGLNTWYLINQTTANYTLSMFVAYMTNPIPTSATITVTVSGSSNSRVVVCEYSGIVSVSPVDQSAKANSTSITSITAGPTSPLLYSHDILVSAIGISTSTTLSTSPSGYTLRSSSGSNSLFYYDNLTSPVAGSTPSAAYSWSTAYNSSAGIMALEGSQSQSSSVYTSQLSLLGVG